jgi:hypothetical protein
VNPELPRCLPELLVPALEAGPVGKIDGAAGQMDLLTVDLLEAHHEHRAVRFPQDGRAHLDDVVGPNGEEEPIERGVMQLAQGDAVADDRLALDIAVGRDVRRVQEFLVSESAQRASFRVRSNHPLTEGDLVQPTAERCGHIRTPRLGRVLTDGQRTQGIALGCIEVVDNENG